MSQDQPEIFAHALKFRILSLDGGGAKGIYTLGVLKEVEAATGKRLAEVFDLIYGTSTGAIIASLLALGKSVDSVERRYLRDVPTIMGRWTSGGRSRSLRALAEHVFRDRNFTAFKTNVGIVCTNWDHERPMIFKTDVRLAYGMKSTFKPGFGCTIAKAVQGSCSAHPFFALQQVTTCNQGDVRLGDGGFCANNPTLYAMADALGALDLPRQNVSVLSVGCGAFPEPKYRLMRLCLGWLTSVRLLQKTLSTNISSMEAMQCAYFPDLLIARVNETFNKPELAADFLESRAKKLNLLYQCGRDSFAKHEAQIRKVIG